MILCHELTENGKGDGNSQVFPELLDQVEGTISQVSGDGAYDTWDCHEAIAVRGAKATATNGRLTSCRRQKTGLWSLA